MQTWKHSEQMGKVFNVLLQELNEKRMSVRAGAPGGFQEYRRGHASLYFIALRRNLFLTWNYSSSFMRFGVS